MSGGQELLSEKKSEIPVRVIRVEGSGIERGVVSDMFIFANPRSTDRDLSDYQMYAHVDDKIIFFESIEGNSKPLLQSEERVFENLMDLRLHRGGKG